MYISPALAYIIDVIGKLCAALSYLIMKIAHHRIEEIHKEDSTASVKVYCTATWIIGLILCVLGGTLNVLMLPYCDLVLLSTSVGLSIIFSNILAMRFLGEKLVLKYDLTAFFLVVGGCTGIILLSKVDDETLTVDRVKELLFTVQSIVYMVFTVLLLISSLISVSFLVK